MNFNARLSGFLPALVAALLAAQASGQPKYTFTTFAVPNSTYTGATAIDESGDVTGFYGAPVTGAQTGFLRTSSGKVITVSYPPGATSTNAGGMNKFGVIAGGYLIGTGQGGFFYHKGVYTNVVVDGQPAPVADINDYGYYVGSYLNSGSFIGFLASPSGQITTIQYPGALNSGPVWVKNSGDVIGTYEDASGNVHTFVWNANSGYKTDAIPGVPGAMITDINSSGVMVGGYFNGVTNRGFVYQKGKFQIVLPPGANDGSISSINNKGQVAGAYTTPGTMYVGFIATPAP